MNSAVGDDKENTIAVFRDKIEHWREERYEKLCSRLLRCNENRCKSYVISPSILGMKCPKNVNERVHQECPGYTERKELADLHSYPKPGKTGVRPKKIHKGPPVRQTITSKLRVLQSNPLLENAAETNSEIVDLNGTASRKNLDNSDTVSPEAIFSTPAVGNHQLQFPDSVSVIKHAKSPSKILHSKTFLKYD